MNKVCSRFCSVIHFSFYRHIPKGEKRFFGKSYIFCDRMKVLLEECARITIIKLDKAIGLGSLFPCASSCMFGTTKVRLKVIYNK